jgi:hypothetical protein
MKNTSAKKWIQLGPTPLISFWIKPYKAVLSRPSNSNVVFHHAKKFVKCEERKRPADDIRERRTQMLKWIGKNVPVVVMRKKVITVDSDDLFSHTNSIGYIQAQ